VTDRDPRFTSTTVGLSRRINAAGVDAQHWFCCSQNQTIGVVRVRSAPPVAPPAFAISDLSAEQFKYVLRTVTEVVYPFQLTQGFTGRLA
jgi:hypothetical protein